MVPMRLLILALCLIGVSVAAPKDSIESKDYRNPVAKALSSLKTEREKEDFLVYFLALGFKDWAESQGRPPKFFPIKKSDSIVKSLNISEENANKFEKMNISKDSRIKLLEWTKTEFSLSTRNVLDLLKTRKCQGPSCVGLPDLGEICCPW